VIVDEMSFHTSHFTHEQGRTLALTQSNGARLRWAIRTISGLLALCAVGTATLTVPGKLAPELGGLIARYRWSGSPERHTVRRIAAVARIFVTGSAEGLGQLAARRLVKSGHDVVLHGRNRDRARHAIGAVPGAEASLVGDLASIDETRSLADQANSVGPFQAVIHNAGVYRPSEPQRETVDGLGDVFAINALAPYLLTALIQGPKRLIYLTSGLHRGGNPDLEDLPWRRRHGNGAQAYANSKLFVVVLAFAVARLWPHVVSNAVDPGWVPTRMGGPSAPDDLEQGAETQVWLAVSDESGTLVSGRYLYHKRPQEAHPAASDTAVQDRFLNVCEELTGVKLASGVDEY